MANTAVPSENHLDFWPSSPQRVLDLNPDRKKQIIVRIDNCFITKEMVIIYIFDSKDILENFLKESEWYKLPLKNPFGARSFNGFKDGKFYI